MSIKSSQRMTHLPSHGRLTQHWLGQNRPLQVLRSAAGYYIGTADENGLPMSRESEGYWPERDLAQTALDSGQWPQKLTP